MSNFLVGTVRAVDIKTNFGPAQSFPTVADLINVIVPNILTVAGIIVFIGIVLAGFKIITSAGSGEAEKLAKDKGAFTAAIIGLILIFGAYFLMQIVTTLTGIKFF